MELDLQRADLAAGVALELQHAGQFRQDLALPHGHPLQQLVGRDDGQDPWIASAGLRAIIAGLRIAGQLPAGGKLKFGKVHGAVERHRFARCARIEGRRGRERRLVGSVEKGKCSFLRRLRIRRTKNQHDLPQGHVVAGANAKVDDGPFRDEDVAGRLLDDRAGRGIGQHAKLPGFIAATLDAVHVDQMERVAGRFLRDQLA